MPTLDWLNRDAAFRTTEVVPTCVLRPHAAGHAFGEPGDSGNLLIQGDNLQALKALLPFYRGRVKCVFIDPPYNTKSAFEHYDDNLEHSHYLKVLMDEVFGRGNFVANALWQKVTASEWMRQRSAMTMTICSAFGWCPATPSARRHWQRCPTRATRFGKRWPKVVATACVCATRSPRWHRRTSTPTPWCGHDPELPRGRR